mmetsp:Transcript_8249/g.16975  ORF Transcript_8249/g.16975 Transcript_8249/m.16975 type:complete len:126 (+) Transcript_8249:1-378(+)
MEEHDDSWSSGSGGSGGGSGGEGGGSAGGKSGKADYAKSGKAEHSMSMEEHDDSWSSGSSGEGGGMEDGKSGKTKTAKSPSISDAKAGKGSYDHMVGPAKSAKLFRSKTAKSDLEEVHDDSWHGM